MNLIKKIAFDENGIGSVNYFCNGQQITFEQYDSIENDLFENEADEEFEDECNCPECCDCDCEEDRDLEDIIHDTVVDIYNGSHCPYCIEDRIRDFLDEVFDYLDEEE